jgi:hypothetical protein
VPHNCMCLADLNRGTSRARKRKQKTRVETETCNLCDKQAAIVKRYDVLFELCHLNYDQHYKLGLLIFVQL